MLYVPKTNFSQYQLKKSLYCLPRGGAEVEGAEAALARAVRTGNDGELWPALHYCEVR